MIIDVRIYDKKTINWMQEQKETLFRVIWSESCTEPIQLIDTEKPSSKLTKKLLMWTEEAKEFSEKQK